MQAMLTKVRLAVLAIAISASLHAADTPPRTESLTIWTDKGELFLEYQQPVVGTPARLTAHLTELRDFRAVSKAGVTVRLRKKFGPAVEGTATLPARPGIFQPVLNFAEAGDYSGELAVSGEDLSETFSLKGVRVLQAGETPSPSREAEATGDAVSFLKEQQWKIPFRTVLAGHRKLVHSVRALGEVKDKPGNSVEVFSPIDGRVVSDPPTIGQRVEKGQIVARIAPLHSPAVGRPELEREFVQAEAELAQALGTSTRTEQLASQGAMPAKEVQVARTNVIVARARLNAAKQQRELYLGSQHQDGPSGPPAQTFPLAAPIGGDVVHVNFTRDSLVTRERRLLEIDDLSRVWIEVRVFEPDLPAVREATGAVFHLLGSPGPIALDELDGKIVHVSHHIEAASRTAPIHFEISNPKNAFPIGGFVEADILTAQSGTYLAVPVDALMEDGSRVVVFVHTSGETFERREVTTGLRDRGYVAITEGVKPGERVVTAGAYEIKLSTISGAIPEHGHAH